MTTFIIICVLMAVIAVAAVFYPLWTGGRSDADASQREHVLGILRQQAADLEAERAAGRIDQDEYEETRMELERRVLEEARQEKVEQSGTASKLTKQLAIVLAVIIPAAAAFGYVALGRYTAMDPAFLAAMERQSMQSRGHSAAEMQKMMDDLRAHLEANPQNPEGWFMLARVAASVNRFDDALEAFKRLDALVPNNADIIADMADMMAAANGKVITPDVEKLLQKALSIDPGQWKALALLAINAWDKQQYAKAAEYWERLVQVVPPDFPDLDQIRANIDEAKRLGGVNDSISQSSPNARQLSDAGESVPTASPENGRVIAGTVTLADDLKGKVSPTDTVFIYARPVSGSRMPVAYTSIEVKDLPYNFTLNESMTMAMGADTLRNVDTVIVGARISKTGNFMPQSGDLEGEMKSPVEVGDRGVVVQITSVRQ